MKACGATCTTVVGNYRQFILVDASGTMGPAGVVNTDGQLYRVMIRDVGVIDRGKRAS